jgi:hypothetical protein
MVWHLGWITVVHGKEVENGGLVWLCFSGCKRSMWTAVTNEISHMEVSGHYPLGDFAPRSRLHPDVVLCEISGTAQQNGSGDSSLLGTITSEPLACHLPFPSASVARRVLQVEL